MHIIAHRGVSAHYHENTILAFEKALEIGVYGIELDIHQIEDEFIIFHDFQLDRLTQTRGDLRDLSLARVLELRLKEGHKLPILDELFSLVKGECMLNLELKYVTNPKLLADRIAQYLSDYRDHANANVVISSFNHPLLEKMQHLLKNVDVKNRIKFGALVAHLPVNMAQYAIDLNADIAAIDAELVSNEFVEHAHANNLEVWSYTVNFEKGFKELQAMGVDAVFSNDPELLRKHAE
jgi:glycerophosphoryl diester phosphodiesterase